MKFESLIPALVHVHVQYTPVCVRAYVLLYYYTAVSSSTTCSTTAVDQHSLLFSPRTVLIQLSNVSGVQPTIFVDGLNRLLLIVEVAHEDMAATETDLSLTKSTHSTHHSAHIRSQVCAGWGKLMYSKSITHNLYTAQQSGPHTIYTTIRKYIHSNAVYVSILSTSYRRKAILIPHHHHTLYFTQQSYRFAGRSTPQEEGMYVMINEDVLYNNVLAHTDVHTYVNMGHIH